MKWLEGNEHYQISSCGRWTITKYIAATELGSDEYALMYGAWRRALNDKDSPTDLGQRLPNAATARRLCDEDFNRQGLQLDRCDAG